MNLIIDYNDIQIHSIQKMRLYMQGRPLISLWHRTQRGRPLKRSLPNLDLIDQELTGNFISIDCGGWYFANHTRSCMAIELDHISSKLWKKVFFEYDYLTWHPTYLPDWPVLAYQSTYFKYCTIDDLFTFCQLWSEKHKKLIIALDPSKVQFNYLKYDLLDLLLQTLPNISLRILHADHFQLLFVVEKL